MCSISILTKNTQSQDFTWTHTIASEEMEESEAGMDSSDEGSNVGSTTAGQQDSDEEDSDIAKEAEDHENSDEDNNGVATVCNELSFLEKL